MIALSITGTNSCINTQVTLGDDRVLLVVIQTVAGHRNVERLLTKQLHQVNVNKVSVYLMEQGSHCIAVCKSKGHQST